VIEFIVGNWVNHNSIYRVNGYNIEKQSLIIRRYTEIRHKHWLSETPREILKTKEINTPIKYSNLWMKLISTNLI